MDAAEALARRVALVWQAAEPALAEVRRRELCEMTEAEALAAAKALLELAELVGSPESTTCGLVEQQRLFARVAR